MLKQNRRVSNVDWLLRRSGVETKPSNPVSTNSCNVIVMRGARGRAAEGYATSLSALEAENVELRNAVIALALEINELREQRRHVSVAAAVT